MTLKCANYDGVHTSNFSKCPSLLEKKNDKRPTRSNTSKLPSSHDFPTISKNSVTTPSQPTPSTSFLSIPISTNYTTPNVSYASKVFNNIPSPLEMDPTAIIDQLTSLINNLSRGLISVQDVVVTILNILSLLLNIHG